MTTKINSDTSDGLKITSDTSGVLDIQSAGTTKMTVGTTIDVQGNELVLDADADTSIHASTDDQIDFKVGGSDVGKINSSGIEGANFVLLDSSTLSSDASTIEISASTIGTTYKHLKLYANLIPKSDGAIIFLRMRNNSATILNSVADYGAQVYRGGGTDFNDGTVSALTTVSSVGNATGENALIQYDIMNLRTSTLMTTVIYSMLAGYDDAGIFIGGGGSAKAVQDNQGLQLSFHSGDIASGSSYALYGVKT